MPPAARNYLRSKTKTGLTNFSSQLTSLNFLKKSSLFEIDDEKHHYKEAYTVENCLCGC